MYTKKNLIPLIIKYNLLQTIENIDILIKNECLTSLNENTLFNKKFLSKSLFLNYLIIKNKKINTLQLFKNQNQIFNYFIHIKFTKRNIFITICNNFNIKIITYTIQTTFKGKLKKLIDSKKIILNKLKTYFTKITFKNYSLIIFLKNLKKKEQIIQYITNLFPKTNLKFYIFYKTAHGGCRPKKKFRK